MTSKDVFSKFIPNVKLATKLDADGNEVEVEIREDTEASQCRKKSFDLLLSAGYFRVMIKTLSDFDKIVGGMTWAIEACDFDVDVDLLFHESLTIGSKIALVERVVAVLPSMKCPYSLEPHQIQGLDFISIYPVIQWLVKESVNLRAERSEKLKRFAVGEFHNHFKLKDADESRELHRRGLKVVREIESLYSAKRIFKRKYNVEPDDEKSRVRLTLLEYGMRNIAKSLTRADDGSGATSGRISADDVGECDDEIDVERLVSDNLALAKEDFYQDVNLTLEQRNEIARHYENLKLELQTDVKQLSEQNKTKHLESMATALEKRLQRIQHENDELSSDIRHDCDELEQLVSEKESITVAIHALESQENAIDESKRESIKELIAQNERLKQDETEFKVNCTRIIEELHRKIDEAEQLAAMPDDNGDEQRDELVESEHEKLRICRLQLAKRNRAVISLQRQLDNIPDSTELAQYQKRFLELYNNIGVKHKETKQFYALYNTLNDKHMYLEKEIALLNSIYDNYTQAMATVHTKEQFLQKFEDIVEGVGTTKTKIRRKHDDEKRTRDELNAELLGLTELQRRYAGMIKQFQLACESNK